MKEMEMFALSSNLQHTDVYVNSTNLYIFLFFSYWYNLLKLLQKHGTIEKFDLLFHRSGPLAGFPRGYAFCTYKNTEHATSAKQYLDGQLVGSRHITVRWAHSMSKVSIFLTLFPY